MLRIFSKIVLNLKGWEIKDNFDPKIKKAVVVGAPHTSNWDFFYAILAIRQLGVSIKIIAKDSLFFWPLGGIMRKLGAVPIDRKKSQDFVKATSAVFEHSKQLLVGMSPEGTRKRVIRWKTGFYYLALEAKVPIYLGYIDYKTKNIGVSTPFFPSGNMETDFEQMRNFYTTISPKYEAKWNLEGITNTKV